ncbi:MAG: tetratricopeptide repeat protein [Bacteroidales bacterium]|nr:tetratricopeptide repeat protein [Bacteroidales bacterium]
MKRFIYILVFVLMAQLGYAVDRDSLWVRANDAYSLGEYSKALDIYGHIEKDGYVSARLWYNMGNACYKLQEDGKAILYYERALKLDPSNADVKHNLEIARLKILDKIESVPEFILVTWLKELRNTMSSDRWAWTGVILLLFTALSVLAFRFAPRRAQRKVAFVFACLFLLLTIASFLFSINLKNNVRRADSAIVLVPVSNVKSAPNSTGGNLFILHEGTKVNIIENVGQWSRVELSDGRQGWMLSKDFETI